MTQYSYYVRIITKISCVFVDIQNDTGGMRRGFLCESYFKVQIRGRHDASNRFFNRVPATEFAPKFFSIQLQCIKYVQLVILKPYEVNFEVQAPPSSPIQVRDARQIN